MELQIDKRIISEAVQEAINDIKQNYIEKDVLDKIRADIMKLKHDVDITMYGIAIDDVLEIIDKYKTESGKEKDVNCTDLCKSCNTKGCIFQSGIARSHCDFYKAESRE